MATADNPENKQLQREGNNLGQIDTQCRQCKNCYQDNLLGIGFCVEFQDYWCNENLVDCPKFQPAALIQF